jgi:3'(2'), 5'-bisphosphate nucleotidase
VVEHEPVLGVVAAPALGLTFWGAAGLGAYRRAAGSESERVHTVPPLKPPRVVGSRSHASPQTAAYLKRIGPHSLSAMGSSLKFCLIAEGKADLYPRFGATSEWDTAAGQAVLEAAGGQVTRMDGHRLRYNCRESLINGDFVAFADRAVLPAAD